MAPKEFVAEVLKAVVEYSPIRQAARIGQTSAGSVLLPERTGRPAAIGFASTKFFGKVKGNLCGNINRGVFK